MSNNALYKSTITLLFFLLLQVLFFNNVHILGKGTPFVYLYGLLVLPNYIRKVNHIWIAFLMGVVIDLLSQSSGIHTSATLFAGLIKPYLFKLYSPDKEIEITKASIASFGFFPFFYYTTFIVLIHHTVLMIIETGTLEHFNHTLLRIGLSTALTVSFVVVFNLIKRTEK